MAEEPLVLERTGVTKEQKIGFILLLVLSFFGITLGFVQLRNNLYRPFALSNKIPSTIKDQLLSIDAQRYRDTDNDGLTDFDEEYVQGTSPYLYDTFGYGMSDKEVVDKGLARCPNAGKNCTDAATVLAPTTTISAPEPTVATEQDIGAVLNNPVELRKMLLQSGITKDVLDKVSDAELQTMVNQMLSSTSTPTQGSR